MIQHQISAFFVLTSFSNRYMYRNKDIVCYTYIMKEFQLSSIRKNSATLLVGQSGRGLHDVCYHVKEHIIKNHDIKKTIVITNDKNKISSYDMSCQFKENNHTTYVEILEEQTKSDADILVIFDDELLDTYTHGKDICLNNIVYNVEHYGITLLVLTNSMYCISPCFRHIFDNILMFGSNNLSEDLVVYNNYANAFTDFDECHRLAHYLNSDNKLLVIKRYHPLKEAITRDNTIFYLPKNK